MSAKDVYHDTAKHALEKDGWRITHDPYTIPWEKDKKDLFIDLGAEVIAAEKEAIRIAVEVKSFIGRSEMSELQKALGQFVIYRFLLERHDPERMLYRAVPDFILESLFDEPMGQLLMEHEGIKVLGFDIDTEEVTKWLPQRP